MTKTQRLRIIILIGLLIIVWLNTHWSVALALTLIGLRIEGQDYLLAKTK